VSIKKLKEVHELTHPGACLGRRETESKPAVSEQDAAKLLSTLAAEADEDEDERV